MARGINFKKSAYQKNPLGLWQTPELKQFKKIDHGISDRTWGNMSFAQGEKNAVRNNRQRLFQRCQIDPRKTLALGIVHGSKIFTLKASDLGCGVFTSQNALETDAAISSLPGSTLLVDVGDCPTLLIWDKNQTVVGLVHAGWRGIDNGISSKAINLLKKRVKKSEIYLAFGPSICARCYHFSADVQHPLLNKIDWQKYQPIYPDKSYSFDLQNKLLDQLLAQGLLAQNIFFDPGLCSSHSQDQSGQPIFYSHHRASQYEDLKRQPEGRFLIYLKLNY